MPTKLHATIFCMGIALSRIAMAAPASVPSPPGAQEHAEREAKPGKPRSSTEKKGMRLQDARSLNGLEQELATIGAQADAAAAACVSQPGDNQQACRKQVDADRERAAAAIRRKHEQGGRKD